MRATMIGALALLVGCGGGVKEDKFGEKYSQATCELLFDCLDEMSTSATFFFFDDVDSCVSLVELSVALGNDNCDYDAKAAADCIDFAETATCDDSNSAEAPDACQNVYTGDGCQWLATTTTTSSWTTYSTSSSRTTTATP